MAQEHPDLQLIRQALQGEGEARAKITAIAHPIISLHTNRLCRRYCFDHYRHYVCSLSKPKTGAAKDAAMCEWGNGSYHWMLEDLCKDSRLETYQGKDGAGLENYLNTIASSQAFFERWKDWRFGQRTYVPTYIQQIHEYAGRIFQALKAQDSMANIAQRICLDEDKALEIADEIIIELTKRKRLHLLEQTRFISIDHSDEDENENSSWDIPHHDMPFEDWQQFSNIQAAWEKLEAVEQYVIEALVIEEQDAKNVLAELNRRKISIKKGVSPQHTDRQQLYYFRRKSLTKLARLVGIE